MCAGGGKTDAGVATASGVATGVGWAKGAAAEPPDAGVATAIGVANGVGWAKGAATKPTDAGVSTANGVANGVGWGEDAAALELIRDSELGALLVECLLISATRDASHPIISIAPRMKNHLPLILLTMGCVVLGSGASNPWPCGYLD